MSSLKFLIKYHLYAHRPDKSRSFPYFGAKLHFPKSSYLFKRLCEEVVFESVVVNCLTKFAQPNSWYFDIGANIGLLSLPLLQRVQNLQVASYEPSPSAFIHLSQTRDSHPELDRWIISQRALSDTVGTASFAVHGTAMSAFDGLLDTNRSAGATTIMVETTTLDNEWNALCKPPVSLIKVDIEGAELKFLEGAKACIAHCRPVLLIEWTSRNYSVYEANNDQLLQYLDLAGYQAYSVPGGHAVCTSHDLDVLDSLGIENLLLIPKPADRNFQ